MEGRVVELTILYVLGWRVWVFSSNWNKMYITRQYQSPNSARFHWMAVSVQWKSNGWFYNQFWLVATLNISPNFICAGNITCYLTAAWFNLLTTHNSITHQSGHWLGDCICLSASKFPVCDQRHLTHMYSSSYLKRMHLLMTKDAHWKCVSFIWSFNDCPKKPTPSGFS